LLVSDRPRKLIVVGLEGLSPELLSRAVESGACPRLAALCGAGSVASIIATPPGDAATCWASFGSGASPAAHGVAGLIAYESGCEVAPRPDCRAAEDEAVGTLGERGKAEWLWQAAERAGKRVVMVNFPGAWPPSSESLTVVDGAGPLSSGAVRLVEGHLFATRTAPGDKPTHVLRTTQPSGWANPPDSTRAPLEIAFIVTGDAELQPTEYGWIARTRDGAVAKVDPGLMYCGLIIASQAGSAEAAEPPFDTLVLCRGRDAEHPVARLRVGEWSDWITERIDHEGEVCTVRFRFQLGALSAGGREIALFRTPMFRTDAWASPPELADRLIEASIEARAHTGGAVSGNLADGVAWMCGELCRDGEWDLLFTHLPLPDAVLHDTLNELHPASPQYRAEGEAQAWARVTEAMGLADRFIGEVLKACDEEDIAVAVVSPHGMIPTVKYVWLGKALIDAGLATYVTDEGTAGMRPYLPDSRAILGDHPLAQSVWVNLQDRGPDGIVPPEQYERVRTEIVGALLSMRDPFTNACPVALALRREQAGFLGLAGESIGDVVYLLAPGYTTDPRLCSAGLVDPSLISVDAVCGSAGPLQGVHHGHLPGAELGGFTTNGVLLLAGVGVSEGIRHATPLQLPDVTATLCSLLRIEAPASAEGLVAADLLRDGPCA
jgi:predicted AlkP superfamily phosphohydrolase/phosphomutase